MKTISIAMIVSAVLLLGALPPVAAQDAAESSAEMAVFVVDMACESFCETCSEAFVKACGGAGNYYCKQPWYSNKCKCKFTCSDMSIERLEDVI